GGAPVVWAGGDGPRRLGGAGPGTQVSALRVGDKPLSACAVSPDGKQWLAGSLEGMLTFWDPMTKKRVSTFLAHTRPLSAILYTPADNRLVTPPRDPPPGLWKPGAEPASLSHHAHILAGYPCAPAAH